jgi:hypothetical protein
MVSDYKVGGHELYYTSASLVLLTCLCQIKQLSDAILVSEKKVSDSEDQQNEGAMNHPSEGEHRGEEGQKR